MSGTEEFEEEEISLFDLWEKLRAGWRYVLGGTLIGVLGAAVALFVVPNQYEAMAVVQVGQMGQVGQVGQVGLVGQISFTPAEPPAQAVERMKSPAFQLAVAKAVGDERWLNALLNAGVSSVLSVASPKGALNLIDLKAKGGSPEAAKKIVNAAIEELAKRHIEISKPAFDRLTLEADLAREKLKRAESELQKLNKLASGVGVKDERFTQLSLMTNLRVQKEAEIFQQRQLISTLEGALTPPNTQPAKAIEDVFISDKPVSPKKGLLMPLGLVGGFLFGVMWVFAASAWSQARERRLLNSSGKG
jgi:uncharacterized protein involved in exopolysaccharide biosynthesis